MNKIIQINLAGQAVSIDEKAYEHLTSYLRSLENHFANTESGAEILEDIESRIAELFYGKIKKGNAFINQQDVEEAIQLMGTPADMGIEDEEQTGEPTYHEPLGKKLYRDTDDRVLGGVCSGLAAYFGMDVSVVRILVVVIIIFTGIPLLAYFIMWIVLPEAKTPEQRSRMTGGNTTVNDIVQNVRKEATDVARSVKREANEVADSLKKNSKISNTASSVVTGLEQVVRFFAKIFGAFTLTGLVIIGISLSVFLLANATGGFRFSASDAEMITPSILKSPTLNWIFSISLLSLVLIPIGAVCYAIILFIFNSAARINIKAVFLSWLLSLAIFIGISIYSAGDVNVDSFRQFGEKMRDKHVHIGDSHIYYEEGTRSDSNSNRNLELKIKSTADGDTDSTTIKIITD